MQTTPIPPQTARPTRFIKMSRWLRRDKPGIAEDILTFIPTYLTTSCQHHGWQIPHLDH